MLNLAGKVVTNFEGNHNGSTRHPLFLLTTNIDLSDRLKQDKAFLINKDASKVPKGFKHIFVLESFKEKIKNIQSPYTILPDYFMYLNDDDIIRLDFESSKVRVLYRNNTPNNSIMLTERCNHYCLMCSQPPKEIDDSWLINETIELIKMMPENIPELIFSGGEPTLLNDGFFKIIHTAAMYHPNTAIHILSNGRTFADFAFAQKYAKIDHDDKMVGIPLYSQEATIHNYVVQAQNAFDETIIGILNLKRLKQKVEIRVVIHKQTIDTLIDLANFIKTNLLFVDHVALMGLEITGFTRANLPSLWIDPSEYKEVLADAVDILTNANIKTSIYNHPLCLVPERARIAYKKSISDWKNEYLDECKRCVRREECGGFFSSGVKFKHTENLVPFS